MGTFIDIEMRQYMLLMYNSVKQRFNVGVAKVRKEGSFRERKILFTKGRFFFTFLCPFKVN